MTKLLTLSFLMISIIDLLCRPNTKSTKKSTKPVSQKPGECYIQILGLKSDLHKFYGNAPIKFVCGLVCLVRKVPMDKAILF